MKVLALALNTAREAIRNRILYSILFFAALMVGIASLLGAVSIGDQMKFIKDFTLMSISMFGVIIAIILGVNLLHQELGRKTIYNILSKPVARWEFLVGKFLGLLVTLTLLVTFMGIALVTFLAAMEGQIDFGIVLACGFALLEVAVIVAVAIFFSSLVVTPSLAGLFTAATFVAGRSSGYLGYFYTDDHPPIMRFLAHTLSWVLPRLDRYTIADRMVYGEHLDPEYVLLVMLYTIAYSGVLLLLSTVIFSRREFT